MFPFIKKISVNLNIEEKRYDNRTQQTHRQLF